MILNLCLVPEKKFSEELIKVSNKIDEEIGSEYVVGKNSIPHATLLQFNTEDEKESKEALKELIEKKIIVNTKQLYQNISKHNNSWFGVEIELSEELIELQLKVIKLLNIKEDKIHNQLGKEYFPHFTTGMKAGKHNIHIKEEVITNKQVNCVIKLGISGEHFTVHEIIN